MATNSNDHPVQLPTTTETSATGTNPNLYHDSYDEEENASLPTPPMFSAPLGHTTARIAGRAIKPLPSRARSAAATGVGMAMGVQFPFSAGSTAAGIIPTHGIGAKARWVPDPLGFTSLRSHKTGLHPELTMPYSSSDVIEDAEEHEEYSPSDPLMLPPPNATSMFPSIFDFPFIPFPISLPFSFPPYSNGILGDQSTPQVFESTTFPESAEEWEHQFREALRGAWPRLAHRFFACRFKTFMHVIIQTLNIPPEQEKNFIDQMKSIAELPTSGLEARVHEWDDWWKAMLKWRRRARKKGWLNPDGQIESVVRDIMQLHERLLYAESGMMRILGSAFINTNND